MRALFIFLICCASVRAASILDTKHNLSLTGPGAIKAVTETEVCIFCHTPHRATGEAPLWNRYSSGATYVPYSSSTTKAVIGQPTGASKQCLSCHDGTVALGLVHSRPQPIKMQSEVTTLPPGPSRLGTDLSDDHPISFTYDAALASLHGGELKDPATLKGPVKLDKEGQLQCTSCHDPHNDEFGKFLVQRNIGSALCVNCHAPNYWDQSIHRTSTATWNGQGTDPWPRSVHTTVALNACDNCHTSHNAGAKPRLLNFPDQEQNCLQCHNGNVAAQNLQSEFNKFSVHPITLTGGAHDPAEDPINPPRHITCVDCHNPHAAKAAAASPPFASGSLAGVKGVSSAGTVAQPLAREYELCYRCHADSVARGASLVSRESPVTNTRLEFTAANTSFHPVETIGKNPNVPSLIGPLLTSSLMYCTDCHNNNRGPGAGGVGPKGPHGSIYAPILERQLILADFTPETPANYDLCYKCHSRESILSDQSFPSHRRHVVDAQTSCATCHDPHGVQTRTHLINFNRQYVTPSSNGRIDFVDLGLFRGNCSLTCHGKDHNALSYGSP